MKATRRSALRRWRSLLFAALLLIGGHRAAFVASDLWWDLPFDSRVWQSENHLHGQLGFRRSAKEMRRARMVDDLVDNHLRTGMNRDEVVSLLDTELGDGTGEGSLLSYPLIWPGPYPRQWQHHFVSVIRWGSWDPSLRLAFGPGGSLQRIRVR